MIHSSKAEMLLAVQETLQNTLTDYIFVKDLDSAYVAATKNFAEMVGKHSVEEIVGKTDYDIFENQELAKRYVSDDRTLLERGEDLIDYVEPLTDENGNARYSNTSKYILRDASGKPIGILGISKDITKEIRSQKQYQKEIEFLFTLPADAYMAIFLDVTDWRVIAERRQEMNDYKAPLFETIQVFLETAMHGAQGEAKAFYEQFSQPYLTALYEQGKRDFTFEYHRQMTHEGLHWVREEYKFLVNPLSGRYKQLYVYLGNGRRESQLRR